MFKLKLTIVLLGCLFLNRNAFAVSLMSTSTSSSSEYSGQVKIHAGMKMLDSKTWKMEGLNISSGPVSIQSSGIDLSNQTTIGFSGELGSKDTMDGKLKGYFNYETSSASSSGVMTGRSQVCAYYNTTYPYGCAYYNTISVSVPISASGSTTELDLGVKYAASEKVYVGFGLAKISDSFSLNQFSTSMDGQGFFLLAGADGDFRNSLATYGIGLKYSTAKKDSYELGGISVTGSIGYKF